MCPGAPLLVPGVAPGLAATVPDLVQSCRLAVARLAGADRIILLTSGPRLRDLGGRAGRPTIVHPAGLVVTSAALTGGGCGAGQGPAAVDVGVGVIVGVALLSDPQLTVPITVVEMGDQEITAAELAGAIGSSADRIGLLMIGEGSAARGEDSPAGDLGEAADLDRQLANALARGDPAALAAAVRAYQRTATSQSVAPRQHTADSAQSAHEPDSGGRATLADRVMFTAGPAFAALAALWAARPPRSADLLYDAAPFGVGYLVASWSATDAAARSTNAATDGVAG